MLLSLRALKNDEDHAQSKNYSRGRSRVLSVDCFSFEKIMFGEKALELLRELKRARPGTLPPFNEDLIRQV